MIRRWRRRRNRRAFARLVVEAYMGDVAQLIKPRRLRRLVHTIRIREIVGMVEYLDRADELGHQAAEHVAQAADLMRGYHDRAA